MTTELFGHENDQGALRTIRWSDGSIARYRTDELNRDELHRVDGPAIEWDDGDTEWYQNGKCHRYYGPACDYGSENRNEWWLNGKPII